MPLGPDLESDLEDWFAEGSDAFSGAGTGWADVLEDYFANVVPASTAVSAAAGTLATALAAAFALSSGGGAAMDLAFQAFAATVGVGMGPAFVATPPPSAPGFAAALNRLYVVLGVKRIPRLIRLTEDQYKAKRHKHPEKGLVL